jgi:hypothetical protein
MELVCVLVNHFPQEVLCLAVSVGYSRRWCTDARTDVRVRCRHESANAVTPSGGGLPPWLLNNDLKRICKEAAVA